MAELELHYNFMTAPDTQFSGLVPHLEVSFHDLRFQKKTYEELQIQTDKGKLRMAYV